MTACYAAEEVHLPEAILRHDVALGFGHVRKRGSADVRNAPDVAVDRNLILQAGERGGSVHLGERSKEKPPREAASNENKESQEPT